VFEGEPRQFVGFIARYALQSRRSYLFVSLREHCPQVGEL